MPKILGLDPGLGTTGWGLIQADGNRLSHLANGQLKTDASESLPQRLSQMGVPRAALAELAGFAAQEWTAQFNPRPVDATALGEIYERAW